MDISNSQFGRYSLKFKNNSSLNHFYVDYNESAIDDLLQMNIFDRCK